ncbi:hypothetical protein DFQ27_002928 [Actinomortierella ambigua]|uniref:Dilute domain-containing protein n=1 Tax=Actinomortierella ambigua TaxID=1343610 RepID=A0A9P6U5J6_9FUNG|nr:hypothetical protein DFQ27_002928 [Actinomortierella ambigua]
MPASVSPALPSPVDSEATMKPASSELEPHLLAKEAHSSATTDMQNTGDLDLEQHLKKRLHHISHSSSDSTTTTDDDDLSDHHRRTHSGTDSLYSVGTETTEPHHKDALSPKPASPQPSSTLAANTTTSTSSIPGVVLTTDEELDPWGGNPYAQDAVTSQLRFSRRPGDVEDDDSGLGSSKLQGSSSGTSFVTGAVRLASLTGANQEDDRLDPLERMDREFERLTSGQPLELQQPSGGGSGGSKSVAATGVGAAASSGSSLSLGFDFDREQLDDPRGIVERSIPDEDKKMRLTKMFARAASNGDMNRIADMLDNFREWIDIEAQDEDGTTPLIYAACFGHVEIAFMLLEAGVTVDARDKFGWTALVWATNNKHDNMVRLLLEHGASTNAQTKKGHTIVDFLRHDPNDNTKIVQIFQEPGRRDSISSTSSYATNRNYSPSIYGDDLFYHAGIEGFEEMMAENERRYRMAMDSAQAFEVDMADLSLTDQPQLDDEGEFDWEKCLPDQMFVFSSKDIKHITDIIITNMEPCRSRNYKPLPAYVLFLAARFAHYYSSAELLDELLEAASVAIATVTKSKPEDMTLTAYWVSNATVLVHFLRKDSGLSLASGFHQVKLEGLIEEMLQMLVKDAQRRIEKILESAMLDHDTIQGLEDVKFQSDWAFLWRGSRNKSSTTANKRASSPMTAAAAVAAAAATAATTAAAAVTGTTAPGAGANNGSSSGTSTPGSVRPMKRSSSQTVVPMLNRPPSPRQRRISPRTITTMLSSLLFVMQSYDLPPDLIHYVISQLLYYVSSEVFNRMMTHKRFLSRSKAMQTRLNLSVLEDWIRVNNLPTRIGEEQLGPLIQLLQLLQVLTLQEDFAMWVETMKKLNLLNPFQVKRAVNGYRYEVAEERLPDEITQYVLQVAADTERMVRRQMMERKLARPMTMIAESTSMLKRRNSNSTLASRRSVLTLPIKFPTSMTMSRKESAAVAAALEGEEDEEVAETRRSSSQNTDDDDDGDATVVGGGGAASVRSRGSSQTPPAALLLTEAEKERLRQKKREQEEEAALLSETRDSKRWLVFKMPANVAERENGVERVFVPVIPEELMSALDTRWC